MFSKHWTSVSEKLIPERQETMEMNPTAGIPRVLEKRLPYGERVPIVYSPS
jgi:hypothetical protein